MNIIHQTIWVGLHLGVKMNKGTGHIRNRWVRSLVVQGSELTNSFWSHRPDSFVHFGPPSHSDCAGGHVQWQHGRPQQVYQEHVQKCVLHRKKVASTQLSTINSFVNKMAPRWDTCPDGQWPSLSQGEVSVKSERSGFLENVIFSAQGAPRKSWGTYFYVKLKK